MHCICINKKSFFNKTHISCIPDDKFGMRPRLAVCVKGIFYPDPSAVSRLVEWLELQFILGVEKIFVHYISLSPEALAMLKHYEQRGLVVLKEVVWAGPYLRYCDPCGVGMTSADFSVQSNTLFEQACATSTGGTNRFKESYSHTRARWRAAEEG